MLEIESFCRCSVGAVLKMWISCWHHISTNVEDYSMDISIKMDIWHWVQKQICCSIEWVIKEGALQNTIVAEVGKQWPLNTAAREWSNRKLELSRARERGIQFTNFCDACVWLVKLKIIEEKSTRYDKCVDMWLCWRAWVSFPSLAG